MLTMLIDVIDANGIDLKDCSRNWKYSLESKYVQQKSIPKLGTISVGHTRANCREKDKSSREAPSSEADYN